jgi:hypothetical protein
MKTTILAYVIALGGIAMIVFGLPIPFHGEDTKIYDQLSRIGKGVPLLSHPEWLSVAQLVPAWAKELAETTASFYDLRDKLWYHLEKDVINGLLDDPLRNGSRLGLRTIDPAGHPRYIEGWQHSSQRAPEMK